MNILAALAEMALWANGCDPFSADRSVVDTTIEEFSERMGQLALRMHEIYGDTWMDFIRTM